jgi:hypothetical protein
MPIKSVAFRDFCLQDRAARDFKVPGPPFSGTDELIRKGVLRGSFVSGELENQRSNMVVRERKQPASDECSTHGTRHLAPRFESGLAIRCPPPLSARRDRPGPLIVLVEDPPAVPAARPLLWPSAARLSAATDHLEVPIPVHRPFGRPRSCGYLSERYVTVKPNEHRPSGLVLAKSVTCRAPLLAPRGPRQRAGAVSRFAFAMMVAAACAA